MEISQSSAHLLRRQSRIHGSCVESISDRQRDTACEERVRGYAIGNETSIARSDVEVCRDVAFPKPYMGDLVGKGVGPVVEGYNCVCGDSLEEVLAIELGWGAAHR